MPFIYITYIIWSAAICVTMGYSIQKKCNLMKPYCLPLFWIMHQTTCMVHYPKEIAQFFLILEHLGGKAARIILTE